MTGKQRDELEELLNELGCAEAALQEAYGRINRAVKEITGATFDSRRWQQSAAYCDVCELENALETSFDEGAECEHAAHELGECDSETCPHCAE